MNRREFLALALDSAIVSAMPMNLLASDIEEFDISDTNQWCDFDECDGKYGGFNVQATAGELRPQLTQVINNVILDDIEARIPPSHRNRVKLTLMVWRRQYDEGRKIKDDDVLIVKFDWKYAPVEG